MSKNRQNNLISYCLSTSVFIVFWRIYQEKETYLTEDIELSNPDQKKYNYVRNDLSKDIRVLIENIDFQEDSKTLVVDIRNRKKGELNKLLAKLVNYSRNSNYKGENIGKDSKIIIDGKTTKVNDASLKKTVIYYRELIARYSESNESRFSNTITEDHIGRALSDWAKLGGIFSQSATKYQFNLQQSSGGGLENHIEYIGNNYKINETEASKISNSHSGNSESIRTLKNRIIEYAKKNVQVTSRHLSKEEEFPFIDLGLVEKKTETKPVISGVNRDGSHEDERLKQKVEVITNYESYKFFQEILLEGKSPKKKGRTILIGEPGAGKTTLLHQIATKVIEDNWGIPILISLKDLGDNPNLVDFIYKQWLPAVIGQSGNSSEGESKLEKAKDDFHKLCEEKIWLLLDGLDEMSTPEAQSAFSSIQKQIDELLEIEPHRIILSCRQNLWNNSDSNYLQGFDAFYTRKFSQEQIEKFITNWFPDEAIASKLIEQLSQPTNQNLNFIISNPLLLTILCVVYGEGDKVKRNQLPENRAGLYKKFVPFYYNWKNQEFEILESDKDTIEKKILPNIARANFERSSSSYLILEEDLKKYLEEECGYSEEIEKKYWVEKLEATWLQKIGIAREDTTQAAYCFLHPTFQEYFAAQGIESRDYFLPVDHVDRPVEGKEYRIFEDKWKEIILFWVGRGDLDASEKEAFMKALYEFDDSFHKCFYAFDKELDFDFEEDEFEEFEEDEFEEFEEGFPKDFTSWQISVAFCRII